MKADVRGVSYHIEMMGEGPPLLLLHGFTGRAETWKPFIPEWSKKFRCIMVDIIGHGRTDSPEAEERYGMDSAVKDIVSILEFLKIDKTLLLGYSMGGRLALAFAVRYPERVEKLILESSTPGLKTIEERAERIKSDEALAQFIEREGMEAFVDRWENIPLFASQKNLPEFIRNEIRKERLLNNAKGLAGSLRGMGTGSQTSLWTALPSLSLPVLLVCGEADAKFVTIAEKMHEILPNSEIIKVLGAGHAIHVEKAEIFGKIVDEFFSRT